MPIVEYAEVQSILVGMAARIASLRGVVYAAPVAAHLAEIDPDHVAREGAALLLRWLLSMVKNRGGETAHDIEGKAIVLFGGTGYSIDWPIERRLRHARILAIYEGTTGIQALDLVRRRWLAPDSGYEPFVALVEADLARPPTVRAAPLRHALEQLIATTSGSAIRRATRSRSTRQCPPSCGPQPSSRTHGQPRDPPARTIRDWLLAGHTAGRSRPSNNRRHRGDAGRRRPAWSLCKPCGMACHPRRSRSAAASTEVLGRADHRLRTRKAAHEKA